MDLRNTIVKYFTGSNTKEIKKAIKYLEENTESMRPFQDFIDITKLGGQKIYGDRFYYNLAKESDLIQLIINALNGEIFRNGMEIEEKFVKKCINPECGKEFDIEPRDKVCDECGGKLRDPEFSQKKLLEEKLDKINENEQNLLEVLKEGNTDVERIDDMYFLVSYEYSYGRNGNIVENKFIELTRISPLSIDIIADSMSRLGRNEKGNKVYFCPKNREKLIDESRLKENRCPKCGNEIYRAYYSIGTGGTDGKVKYFANHEIIHSSKYQPSMLKGVSNIVSCSNKLITLKKQDEYIRDCYVGKRSPNGLLLISTSNYKSFDEAWDRRVEKAKVNPNAIYPIVSENKDLDGKNKDWVQFINLMMSPKEMEMIPLREEYRKFIGGMYRVMPIWMSDSGKGVGQEGLQIVVTNRGIMEGQSIINNKILKKLSQYIGSEDYVYKLAPNEKRDELTELQTEALKIQNAQGMELMGFKPKLTEAGEFEYEDADPSTEVIDPAGKQITDTGNIQNQRFEGEPEHNHNSQGQRFEGETQNVHRNLEMILKKEIDEVKKEFNLEFVNKKSSLDDLTNFIKINMFKKSFENLSKEQSDKIKEIFIKAVITKTGYRELTKNIMKIVGDDKSEGEVDVIVRTEMNALKNKSREYTFKQADPAGERLYKWQSVNDSRRTSICKNISLRTVKGVTLKRLKEIVKEESLKANPKFEVRDWIPHINCRSVVIPI